MRTDLHKLRTTGFRPLRPGKIHLRCPKCGRKSSNAKRDETTDPKTAVLVELHCDKCSHGGKGGDTCYFDEHGVELNWETGKPYGIEEEKSPGD